MSRAEIKEKVEEIFKEFFDDIEEITDDMSSGDIEDWDSLAQVRILAAIEGSFGIKFTIEEIPKMVAIGDMINLLEEKLNA